MNPTRSVLRTLVYATFWLAVCAVAPAMAAEPVDYARDVRPILAARCFGCHGEEKQESGLRLDAAAALVAGGNGGPAIVAGKSGESLLVRAVRGKDDEVSKMPPEGEGEALTDEQIALVARWIDEGAKVPDEGPVAAARRSSEHWSFQPVARPAVPAVKNTTWARSPLDAFVLAKLEAAGLEPSREADKLTLIRRASLDLRGLPPSLAEIEEFVADTRGDAYERLVDRLLASPHYGEHWGRHWLDVARYADSNGYTIDGGRSIWKYRDWVIAAVNRDLPFDQFAIEQLAGDMLDEPSLEQQIATGFHRNTLVNEEGGTDPEQFRVEAVVDRVSTTGGAFLGLTLGCARCHDHKYDPISQREFYQVFALFNNADEPALGVPTDQQSKEMPALKAEIEQSLKRLAMVDANIGGRQSEWEQKLAGKLSVNWTVLDARATSAGGAEFSSLADGSLLAGGKIPEGDTYTVRAPVPGHAVTAVMLEVLPHESLPGKGPGLGKQGGFVLYEAKLSLETPDGKSRELKLASATSDYVPAAGPIQHAIDGNLKTGWRVTTQKDLGLPRSAIFMLAEPLKAEDAGTLSFELVHKKQKEPLQIGRLRIAASSAERDVLTIAPAVRDALVVPVEKRTDAHKEAIRLAYQPFDAERAPLAKQIGELEARQKQVEKAVTTTLVMRERQEPRETHIHVRGDFLRAGAIVRGDVPAVLPPLQPRGQQADRLDFARWMVAAENPLTPRVTANRVWQHYFGTGLVATENDFGLQGDRPTHPELLDWLASQLVAEDWSMKALHRLIVTSATYRQSSQARSELAAADPYNKLLGRQQRLRLEAENIRDVALAASGLLSREIGGPGVYPPQPAGIYAFTQQVKFWGENKDSERYRRGMYTYFWRSSPYPFLKTFDAPDATVACTRRARSNTPLQALTMANDRALFEIAQGFAVRLLSGAEADDAARLRAAFRQCLAREPAAEELATLGEYLQAQQKHFAESSPDAAAVAPAARPAGCDEARAAAWTMVARVMLNLDEFITRE